MRKTIRMKTELSLPDLDAKNLFSQMFADLYDGSAREIEKGQAILMHEDGFIDV